MYLYVFILGVVWRWLEGHNMCFFLNLLIMLGISPILGTSFEAANQPDLFFPLWLKVVDPKKCWFPICKLLDPCLGPLGHGLKK